MCNPSPSRVTVVTPSIPDIGGHAGRAQLHHGSPAVWARSLSALLHRGPVARAAFDTACCRWQARRGAPVVRRGTASRVRWYSEPIRVSARLLWDYVVAPALLIAVAVGWWLLPVIFGPDAG